jgi:hypothetical protein
VQKTPLKLKDKPDDDSKAKGPTGNLRDARSQQKSESPNRTSGSVHKETGQKAVQKQVKKQPRKG